MNVREHIVDKLIAAGGFWSYDEKSVRENMSDEQLIEAALEKLEPRYDISAVEIEGYIKGLLVHTS